LFRRAQELCPPGELHVGLVWDEQPADGRGGTADLVALVASTGAPLAIINPAKL
jgi:hypothetical protein